MSTPKRLPLTRSPLQDIPFVFPSYRELVHNLGAVDGLAAGLTIATSKFIEQSLSYQDPQLPAKFAARKYAVRSDYVDLVGLAPHLNQLLVVGTYQQSEAFLSAFRREQSSIGRKWSVRDDEDPPLKHVLENLEGGFQHNVTAIWKERYDIHEYYRNVRNTFVHISKDKTRINSQFAKISSLQTKIKDEYGLEAPNQFGRLTFDDHMLFTIISKYIATDLCRLAPPRTPNELLKFVVGHIPDDVLKSFILHRREHGVALKTVEGWLRQEYNFNIETRPEFGRLLLRWVNTLPSRRARKESGAESASVILRKTLIED